MPATFLVGANKITRLFGFCAVASSRNRMKFSSYSTEELKLSWAVVIYP
jgi:hypothetical protein